MNQHAPIGDNNPPDPIDEALAPYGDFIAEAENWLDGTPVQSEAQMKEVDGITKQVKAALKAVKTAEESAAKPIYDQWKSEKAKYAPTIDDLTNLSKGLVSLVSAFKADLARKKAEEERKAREEAEAARRAAEAAQREADAGDIDAVRAAADAQHAAEVAQAEAAAASKQKVKGMRTVHKHEITDMRALVNWIATNDKEAMAAFATDYARRNHKEKPMNGVRSWTEKEAF